MRRGIGLLTVMLMLALAASSAAAKPAIQIVKVQLSGANLNVTLSCAAGPCKGSLLLAKVSAGKQSPRAVLAKRSYAIPAHHQKTVTAKLTARGRTLLRAILHGKAKPLPAKLTATVTGGATQSQNLKFP